MTQRYTKYLSGIALGAMLSVMTAGVAHADAGDGSIGSAFKNVTAQAAQYSPDHRRDRREITRDRRDDRRDTRRDRRDDRRDRNADRREDRREYRRDRRAEERRREYRRERRAEERQAERRREYRRERRAEERRAERRREYRQDRRAERRREYRRDQRRAERRQWRRDHRRAARHHRYHDRRGYRTNYRSNLGISFHIGTPGYSRYLWAPSKYGFYNSRFGSYDYYRRNTNCYRTQVDGWYYGHPALISVKECYNPWDGYYIIQGSERLIRYGY